MNSIVTYLYTQNIRGVTIDERVANTMSLYYTPHIKLYKGVGQTVRFEFRNRDNKKVSILGKTVELVITDKDAGTSLLTKTVQDINAAQGTGSIRFESSDFLNLPSKFYTYGLKITDAENLENPVFTDDSYNCAGTLELEDGVYPTFVASRVENFATGNIGSTIFIEESVNRNSALHTAQVSFDSSFTGTLDIQVSLSSKTQSLDTTDFYTLKTITYTSQTQSDIVSFKGIYSAIRFIRSGTGISQVLYRP